MLRLTRDIGLVFIVTIVLLEATLRIYHGFNPVFVFADNSDIRFRGKPFSRTYDFNLNSGGFKDTEFMKQKDPHTFRIAGIGDSFVFGVVPYRYNFLTLLEDNLLRSGVRAEVLNMGVPATSPREYLSLLIKEALPLKPDAVLICLFIGNDFLEVSPQPILRRLFVPALARYIYDLFTQVEGGAKVWTATEYDDQAPTFKVDAFLEVEASRSMIFRKANSVLSERLPLVMAYIEQIKAVCDAEQMALAVMLIPDEVQVNVDLQRQVAKKLGMDLDELDFALPNKLLADELRRQKLDYVDLLEAFRETANDMRLYKPLDTHWNIAGNKLAAALLAEFLTATWNPLQRINSL